jgi:hypothetical protein
MAVAFSENGNMIASFSLMDNTIKLWGPTKGFFHSFLGSITADNAFGTTLSCIKTMDVKGINPAKKEPNKKNIIEELKISWESDKLVKLQMIGGLVMQFTV